MTTGRKLIQQFITVNDVCVSGDMLGRARSSASQYNKTPLHFKSGHRQGTEMHQLLRWMKSCSSGSQNLHGYSSSGMLPRKQDIADSCPIAVDTQESEGQGYLGDPRAPSLHQEVDEDQTESRQHRKYHLVFRAGKKIK